MLELIEHAKDITALISDALSILRPGGSLLISTSNRDVWDRNVVWEVEAPPTPRNSLTPVAQLVEQVAVNHLVTGSSTVGGASCRYVVTSNPSDSIWPFSELDVCELFRTQLTQSC